MDDVGRMLAGLLVRASGDAGPGPGDGLTLTCVPGPLARPPGELRWELLVTRAGAVVREVVATGPAAALRSALSGADLPAGGSVDDDAPAGEEVPVAPLLGELERVAASLPLVVDLDAVWDLTPEAGPAWRWTVAATRWDVLVEGTVLRWEGADPGSALAAALADLAERDLSR